MMSREYLSYGVSAVLCCLLLLNASTCLGQETNDEFEQLSQYELMIQYTKLNRDLADIELQRALGRNEKLVTVSRLTIERLRSSLAVAEEQYKQANLASTGGPEAVRLRHAEEKVKIAKMELEAGQRLSSTGNIHRLDLQRLRLRYDLAQLRVVMLKNPDNFVTLMDSMDRRMDRLSDEILSLDQRLTALETENK